MVWWILVDSLRACVFEKVDFRLSAFLYIYCMSVYYMLCFQLFLIVSGQFTIFLQGLHEFATKRILDLFGAVEGSLSNSWNAFCLSKTICTEMRNINQIID